jgi:Tfp pilus assembly protein FimT
MVTMAASSSRRKALSLAAEAGVTLVELMTVVGIIAITTALAVPSFTNWLARSQLKEALLELHGNLNLARMTAMNRNTTITATLALVNNRVTATFTDPSATSAACLASRAACALPTQTMPGQVTGFGGASLVQFNSLGLRVGGGTAAQAIQLTNSKGVTFEIQITAAGKARWCAASPCP